MNSKKRKGTDFMKDTIFTLAAATLSPEMVSESCFSGERETIFAGVGCKRSDNRFLSMIMDAIEGRAYSGEIIEVGTAYVIHKINEWRYIINNLHYLKDFTRLLNESNIPYLEITYDREMNGSVDISETGCQERVVSMGR